VARGEDTDIGAGRVRSGAGLHRPPRVLGETRWSDIRGAAEIRAVGPAADTRHGSQWAGMATDSISTNREVMDEQFNGWVGQALYKACPFLPIH